jgi:membrane fusion protein (multidrug efflux system)
MSTDAPKPKVTSVARDGAPVDSGDRAAPEAAAPKRSNLKVLWGVVTLVVIAAGITGYWFFFMRGLVDTDDARLNGHLVDLAPEINGRLTDVLVHEGQFVHRGDEIFRLDPALPQAALNQAEASLVSAKASLASSQAKLDKAVNGSRPEEILGADATVKRLKNEEEMTRLNLERAQTLFKQGSAAADELDRARTAYASARESSINAAQNLTLLQQGSRKEDIDAAKADVALAQSRVGEATAAIASSRSDLARCLVTAPFDGWVVRRWLDPGSMPLIAQPVVSLFDPATLRVDANIEEKYLGEVAIGDTADITVDAFPSLHLEGRVTEILRATNSQFSLMPAEGVSGTFIKVTQRVPLRLAVTAPPNLTVGPGLSVDVKIRVGSAPAAKPQ